MSALATAFRRVHVPGKPIILTNVYDAVSARVVASLPGTQALATASYAVAAAAGLEDPDLTLEANLAGARSVSIVAKQHNLPLTVDWQDGYGDRLEEGISKLLDLGVVGINLEDFDSANKDFFSLEVASDRVKRVLNVAEKAGVSDFVVNARCDTLVHNGPISEAIARGKAYLAAGATTVFVWGGVARGGITREEVVQLAEAFDGRLNVSLRLPELTEGKLTVKEIADIGVARISIGPQLQLVAQRAMSDAAGRLLASR